MSLNIRCDSCGSRLQVKDRLAGQTIRCPGCGGSLLVTAPVSETETVSADGRSSRSADEPQHQGASRSIGRFTIRAVLGQGGFGTVYRAYDPVLEREVALKTPRADLQGAERLVLEAKTAARLRHPHIVPVFEAGADGDDLFIAAEYVPGETLADVVARGAVSVRQAAEWTQSLAGALAYAHAEGIVHRDVKPHNIMIGRDGRPQLMDFGLAQSASTVAPADTDGDSASAGTPAYMSPEQVRGDSERIGPASDQYSLGAVLYEMLTGRAPFSGDAGRQVAAGAAPRPPRELRVEIPRDLEAISLKAMAADPARRYPDCNQLADDLSRWLNGELVRARRYSGLELAAYWARRRPALFGWTAAGILLAILLLGGGAAYGINALASSHDAEAETAPTIELGSEKTDDDKSPPVFAASSDYSAAEMLQYGRLLDRTRCAYRLQDVVAADRWLEQTRWDYRGWEYNYLRRIVTGGRLTIAGHMGEVTALAVHPDGTQLVSGGLDGAVRVWDACTGEKLHELQSLLPVTSLAYSPDGGLLAVATGNAGERPSQSMHGHFGPPAAPTLPSAPGAPQADLESGVSGTIAPEFVAYLQETPIPAPAQEAPSQVPAAQGAPVPANAAPPPFAVTLFNARTLQEIGAYRGHAGPVSSVAFSPDGTQVASAGAVPLPAETPPDQFVQPAGAVHLWNPQSFEKTRELSSPSAPVGRIAFAPDGHRLAATSGNGPWGAVLVWNLDPNGQSPQVAATPQPPVVGPEPIAETNVPVEVDLNAPLLPEKHFPGGHSALAFSPQNGGQLIAAPSLDLWLLEQGRRRIAGDRNVVHRWPLGFDSEGDDVRTPLAGIFDVAVSPESGPFGQHTVALAGGDALSRQRPGVIELRDPGYEYGANVPYIGHTSAATVVAFRPDGRVFVSGDASGTLKVWNAQVHPEVVRFPVQPSATRVAFGADGRVVAIAGASRGWTEQRNEVTIIGEEGQSVPTAEPQRGTVKLCDVETGRELMTFTSGLGDVLGLAMDPDMEWIAAGGEDAHVHVWKLDGAQPLHNLQSPGVVKYLAVSRDGELLAAACGSAAMPAGSPNANPAPMAPAAHVGGSGELQFVAFQDEPAAADSAAGDSQPASSSTDGTAESQAGFLVVWRVSDGEEVARWRGHEADALSAAFSPDGIQLVSSGADRAVRVWNIADQTQVRALQGFDGEIVDLAFRPNGEDIAGAGFDPCQPDRPGDVLIWNAADGTPRLTLTASGLMHGVAYSPDGERLATAGGAYRGSLSRPGEVKIWDADTGIELLPLTGRPGRAQKTEAYATTYTVKVPVTVSKPVQETVTRQVPKEGPDGETVYEEVTEIVTREVFETQFRDEQRTRMQESHVEWEEPGAVLGVAFSGDGRSLAAACEDGSALVWDAWTCEPRDSTRWASGAPRCVAASPNGKWLAVAGDSGDHCGCIGIIRIYDARTGRLARAIETTTGPVLDIAFTPDSERMVTVGGCGNWFPATCGPESDAVPLRPEVYQGFFDLQQSIDKTAQGEVWSVATGGREAAFTGKEFSLNVVSVHPVDGRILTAGQSGVQFWGSEGEPLRQWTKLGAVMAIEFSPDGLQFAAYAADGRILLGDPDSEAPPAVLAQGIEGITDLSFNPEGSTLAAVAPVMHGIQGPVITYSATGEVVAVEQPSAFTRAPLSDSKLYLWNLDSPQSPRVHSLKFPAATVDFEPRSNLLAIGGWDRIVALLDPESGAPKLRLRGHRGMSQAAVLPDGRVASISDDHRVIVWRVPDALDRLTGCATCTAPRQRTIPLEHDYSVFVTQVRFSGDGHIAAVGGHSQLQTGPRIDHPVRLVDAATGESRHTGGHYDTVRSVDVHPLGREFASVGQDQNLYFWNVDGTSRPTDPHPNKLMKIVYSPEGSRVATSTAFDGQVYIWDAASARELRRFQAEPETAFALVFTADGSQLVTAGLSGSIRVWSVETGELLREWAAHQATVQSLVFNHAGTQLASCSHDQTVKIWSFDTGELLRMLEGFAGPAWDCDFSPDDELIAVGAHEPIVRIFNVAGGEIVKELPDHGAGVWDVEFSPDSARLACCGRESSLVVWNWQEGSRAAANAEAGECLAWFPDGSRLVTGSVIGLQPPQPKYNGVITLYDATTGRPMDFVTIPDAVRPPFDLSREGRYVAVGRTDGVTVLWDREHNGVIHKCRGGNGPVLSVAFHPDGELFASGGQDGAVRIWSIDGTEQFALPHTAPINALAFGPAGNILAAGDTALAVHLWDIDRREEVHLLTGHYGELCGLSFNGSGRLLAATSRRGAENGWEGDLKVWDVSTGELALDIPSHTWWEAEVAFHPTEPHVASTGKDHTLQVFHAGTGDLLLSIPTQGYLCEALAYSPDGRRLLVKLAGRPLLIDATPEPSPLSGY